MIIFAAVALCAATVPLAGGRLSSLNDLVVRHAELIVTALVIQIVIISVIPDQLPGIHAPAHILSYVLAGAFFVVNRHIAGLWILSVGGGLNFVAIASNGGVMPATSQGVAASGAPTAAAGAFINSAPSDSARLAFLGDVFTLPESWPLSNVFSIGDVLIVVGVALVLHLACGSRLVPRHVAVRTVWPGQGDSSRP